MGAIPLVQSNDRLINQLQQGLLQALNPLIANPVNNGVLIQASLVVGTNVINHKLGRLQQGWIVADVDSITTLFRSVPFNKQNLTLVSSAVANVIIYCF